MAEQSESTQEIILSPKRRGLLWRLGCGLILIIWFLILLTPCFFLVLASQQEIRISQGELPGQEIRVWLVMDEKQRGLGISSTFTQEIDGAICLQTSVSYVLWQGSGEASQYCDCFIHPSAEASAWTLAQTYSGACGAV